MAAPLFKWLYPDFSGSNNVSQEIPKEGKWKV